MFGEWYQKTNKTEDTNKLTSLAFKIIAIPYNTRLATFIKLLESAAIQQRVTAVLRSIPNEEVADSFQKLYERCQSCVVKDDDYFEGQ
jgi:hypothetical protein